jgi:hypothetical protein
VQLTGVHRFVLVLAAVRGGGGVLHMC